MLFGRGGPSVGRAGRIRDHIGVASILGRAFWEGCAVTLAEQEPLALTGSQVRATTRSQAGRSGRSLVGRRSEFPPPGQGAGVPLAHLRREATSLQVVAAPSGMSVVVTSVAIWDPSTTDALRGGEVVLAVGVAADGSMVTQLFEAAVRANAAAVVLKDASEIQWAAAQAVRAGIALITIPRRSEEPHV